MQKSQSLTLLATAVVASVMLAACGQAPEAQPDKPTDGATAARTQSAAPETASPAPEPTSGFENSIIVTSCEGDLGEVIVVTGYDPKTGEQLARTAFDKPALANGEVIGSHADCFATQNLREDRRAEGAFNDDFTQLYGAKRNPDQTRTIGTISQEGEFIPIIPFGTDKFAAQDLSSPVLHKASGRVFYWDETSGETKLYSVKPDGSDIRLEPETEAKFHSDNIGEHFALPDTKEPAPLIFMGDDSAYNEAGTLKAYDDQGRLKIGKSPLDANIAGIEIPDDNDAGSCDALALLNDDKLVVCKDRSQIFTLQLQGGTIKVTTLFDNTGDLEIGTAKVSRDGSQVAFVGKLAGVNALYTIPTTVTDGKPKEVVANVGALPVLLDYRN